MHPEVAEYRQLSADKSEAKQAVMAALGRAYAAEHNAFVAAHDGRLPEKDELREWADANPVKAAEADRKIVEEQGINGAEGKAFAAMQSLAERFVTDHPEAVSQLTQYEKPDGNQDLVRMVHALKVGEFDDAATVVEMFELAKFERQHIGGSTKTQLRLPGKVGV